MFKTAFGAFKMRIKLAATNIAIVKTTAIVKQAKLGRIVLELHILYLSSNIIKYIVCVKKNFLVQTVWFKLLYLLMPHTHHQVLAFVLQN